MKRSFAAARPSITSAPASATRAEQRVEQPDQEQEERQPRRVEQRDHRRADQEAAQRADVAQRRQVLAAPPARASLREQRVEHVRAELAVERDAAGGEQRARTTSSSAIMREREPRAERQHDQRFLAAAGQHAVEHLQHVQRGHQQQQVDRQAEQPA